MSQEIIASEKSNNTTRALEEKKRFRDYIFFFSGQQISILGSSIVSFVLIWWLAETTQSELMLGLASFCSLGPFLIVAPFSGVIADRAKRKPLLLSVDALQALFTVVLTILFMILYFPNLSNPTEIRNKTFLITAVFITLGLRGAMQAFHSPVVSALTPTMVPQKHYSRMNGANHLINGIINVIGPALGALLLNLFDIGLIMWIDAITFSIAVIPLIIIKIPSPKQVEKSARPKFRTQFNEGIQVIKGTKGLFPLMIGATLINFFFSPVGTLLPLFVSSYHMGTKENYALVIGLLQAGTIIGALFMTFFKGFKKRIRSVAVCILILFAGQALLIAVPPTLAIRFWVIGIILFLAILPNPMANATFGTVMQLIIPKDKMGRVSSVIMFLSMAITPIGNFLSGLIGEYVSMPILFTVSSVLGIISFLSIYLLTPARKLDDVIEQKIALRKKEQEDSLELNGDETEHERIIEDDILAEKPHKTISLEEKSIVSEPSLK